MQAIHQLTSNQSKGFVASPHHSAMSLGTKQHRCCSFLQRPPHVAPLIRIQFIPFVVLLGMNNVIRLCSFFRKYIWQIILDHDKYVRLQTSPPLKSTFELRPVDTTWINIKARLIYTCRSKPRKCWAWLFLIKTLIRLRTCICKTLSP